MEVRPQPHLPITILIGLFISIVIFIWPDNQTHLNAQTTCSVPEAFAATNPKNARWGRFQQVTVVFYQGDFTPGRWLISCLSDPGIERPQTCSHSS